MVKELITDGSGNAVELEGEGEGDTLEVRASETHLKLVIFGFVRFGYLNPESFCSTSTTTMRMATGWF